MTDIKGFWFYNDDEIAGEPQFVLDIEKEYKEYRYIFEQDAMCRGEAVETLEEFTNRWHYITADEIENGYHHLQTGEDFRDELRAALPLYVYDDEIEAFLNHELAKAYAEQPAPTISDEEALVAIKKAVEQVPDDTFPFADPAALEDSEGAPSNDTDEFSAAMAANDWEKAERMYRSSELFGDDQCEQAHRFSKGWREAGDVVDRQAQEIEALKSQVLEQDTTIYDLQCECGNFKMVLEDWKAENETLKGRVAELEETIEALMKEHRQRLTDEREKSKTKLRQKFQEYEEIYADQEREKADLEGRVAELEAQNKELQS